MPLKFALVVLAGIVVFLGLPIWVRSEFCPLREPVIWHIETRKYTNDQQDKPDSIQYGAIKPEAKNAHDKKGNRYSDSAPDWLCEEFKTTDLLLVFLTYVLAALGWFQLRSADENTRKAERAYLFVGPFFGVPKDGKDPEKIGRAEASMFNGPWWLAVYNFGRTPAYLSRVEWGLCPLSEYEPYLSERVSKILESEVLAKYVREPFEHYHVFSPGKWNQIWQISIADRDEYIGHVLFGRLEYKDVFDAPHYSTFCFHICAEHSPAIGTAIEHD